MSGVSIIVAGATGAIGRTVVQRAIQSPHITRVVALTRQKVEGRDAYPSLFDIYPAAAAAAAAPKETEEKEKKEKKEQKHELHLTDNSLLDKLEPVTLDWEKFTSFWEKFQAKGSCEGAEEEEALRGYANIFKGHTYAAMCLGTTRADAGSAEAFIRCDYDYVLAFTEAVLSFSATQGLVRGSGSAAFARNIGDGTSSSSSAKVAVPTGSAVPLTESSKTLRAFTDVSAYNAKSDSWLLYMKTKGCADEGIIERVHAHNVAAREKGGDGVVEVSVVRPGILERHGKARTNEKIGKVFMSAIPVEDCGNCAVRSLFSDYEDGGAEKKAKRQFIAAAGKGGLKASADAIKAEPFYVFFNSEIKGNRWTEKAAKADEKK